MPPPDEYAPTPPPMTSLERLLLDSGYDYRAGSFDEQSDRVREHLRREIVRVRELRGGEESVASDSESVATDSAVTG